MLQVRMSTQRGPWLERLGPAIAHALREHPLAPRLDAIALIGTGDPLLVRPGDPALKVMIPLLGEERGGPMARRQMTAMSALVLIDATEAPPVLRATLPIVIGSTAPASAFLRSASTLDQMQADLALAGLPDLDRSLQQARMGALSIPITPDQIADATIEAAVAVGASSD